MNQPPAAHADRHRPSMGPPRHDRPVGPALRAWRDKRRLSQLALALDVGVSTRHLSFQNGPDHAITGLGIMGTPGPATTSCSFTAPPNRNLRRFASAFSGEKARTAR